MIKEIAIQVSVKYIKSNDLIYQRFTILGSKTPHIQNLAVGGVANAINMDDQNTLNMNKLYRIRSLIDYPLSFRNYKK